jgi:hypothetical protein
VHRREYRAAKEALQQAEREARAREAADRASLAEAELRQHEQRRAAYGERHAPERAEARRVVGQLAWRKRATARAVEILLPQYVRDTLGQCLRPGWARERVAQGGRPDRGLPRALWHHRRQGCPRARAGRLQPAARVAGGPPGGHQGSGAPARPRARTQPDPRTDTGAGPMRWLDRIAQ